jgi:hypothetical protein
MDSSLSLLAPVFFSKPTYKKGHLHFEGVANCRQTRFRMNKGAYTNRQDRHFAFRWLDLRLLVTAKTCAPAVTRRKDTGVLDSIFPPGSSVQAIPTGVFVAVPAFHFRIEINWKMKKFFYHPSSVDKFTKYM